MAVGDQRNAAERRRAEAGLIAAAWHRSRVRRVRSVEGALDATGTVASNSSAFTTFFLSTANNQISGVATYSGYAGLGFHYLQAIESGGTSAAFNGVNGITHAGLSATIWH